MAANSSFFVGHLTFLSSILDSLRNCFAVYYLDKKAREEKMAYKGDTFALSANQSADIRFTDGGAVKLRIAGNEIEAGRAGEIYAVRITWVNAGDGIFKLALIPIT